jgi:hypothetical protein
MKIQSIKFGISVLINGKETMFAKDDRYDIEYKENLIYINEKNSPRITITTFSNVVYFIPQEVIVGLTDSPKNTAGSGVKGKSKS